MPRTCPPEERTASSRLGRRLGSHCDRRANRTPVSSLLAERAPPNLHKDGLPKGDRIFTFDISRRKFRGGGQERVNISDERPLALASRPENHLVDFEAFRNPAVSRRQLDDRLHLGQVEAWSVDDAQHPFEDVFVEFSVFCEDRAALL